MALVALASAKGSPGVTTTALALGGLWPRPVLVAECDPSGSDVALRMPGPDGKVLDPQVGLMSLVAAGRKSLHPGLVRDHLQTIVGGLEVLVGVGVPEQASGFAGQWPQLGQALAGLPGQDVVVDLGRIGATTPQNAVLGSAHAIVLVLDTRPSNVVHARERLRAITEHTGGPLGTPVHAIVVAETKRRGAVNEVREALDRASLPVAAVHHVAVDRRGANVFQGQVSGSPARTPLVRSVQPIARTLAEAVSDRFLPAAPPEVLS